jgi:hypothetical protein
MEYFREQNNTIQADFALRAGKLLKQYSILTTQVPPKDKYDATLAICVIQSLLTICSELLSAMKYSKKVDWSKAVTDVPRWWGVKRSFIKKNTFPTDCTYEDFIEHLRNALCHPTSSDREPKYLATGYTTLLDGSGFVTGFSFTDSPWVSKGSIHSRASSHTLEKVEKTVTIFKDKHGSIELDIERDQHGRYQIFCNNEIYLPVFVAEIALPDLLNLAIELANHLAQPTQKKWDGVTINRLIL